MQEIRHYSSVLWINFHFRGLHCKLLLSAPSQIQLLGWYVHKYNFRAAKNWVHNVDRDLLNTSNSTRLASEKAQLALAVLRNAKLWGKSDKQRRFFFEETVVSYRLNSFICTSTF